MNTGLSAALGIVDTMLDFGLQQMSIDKQNYYNSPKEQLSRMKNAGLNPNLIYGSLQPSTQTGIPDTKSSQIAQNVIAARQLKMEKDLNDAQIENLKADTDNKKAQNPQYIELSRQLKMANDMQELFNSYIKNNPDEYYIPQIKRFNQELEHIKRMDDFEAQKLALQKLLNDKQIELMTEQIAASKSATKRQDKLADSQVSLNKKQEGKIDSEVIKIDAETNLINQDINNYVERYLTKPTPYAASALLKFFEQAKEHGTSLQTIERIIDDARAEKEEFKDALKLKAASIYQARFDRSDETFTYKTFISGKHKGKQIRINHHTGEITFVN